MEAVGREGVRTYQTGRSQGWRSYQWTGNVIKGVAGRKESRRTHQDASVWWECCQRFCWAGGVQKKQTQGPIKAGERNCRQGMLSNNCWAQSAKRKQNKRSHITSNQGDTHLRNKVLGYAQDTLSVRCVCIEVTCPKRQPSHPRAMSHPHTARNFATQTNTCSCNN